MGNRIAPYIETVRISNRRSFQFSKKIFGTPSVYTKIKVPITATNDYPDFEYLTISFVTEGEETELGEQIPPGGMALIPYKLNTLKLKAWDADEDLTDTDVKIFASPTGGAAQAITPNISVGGDEDSAKQTAIDRTLENADETSVQSVTLDTSGRPYIEVYASADTATTFRLDVKTGNSSWITNWETWAGVTGVKEGYINSFRYIRLKSDSAGASGDTVTLILTAGR